MTETPERTPEHVEIQLSADVRVRCNQTVWVPKDMWDRVPSDELWSDEVDKFLRENFDIISNPWGIDYDEHDVEITDVLPAAKPESSNE